MFRQIAILRKSSLSAHSLKWLFTSMDFEVVKNIPCFCKLLLTAFIHANDDLIHPLGPGIVLVLGHTRVLFQPLNNRRVVLASFPRFHDFLLTVILLEIYVRLKFTHFEISVAIRQFHMVFTIRKVKVLLRRRACLASEQKGDFGFELISKFSVPFICHFVI